MSEKYRKYTPLIDIETFIQMFNRLKEQNQRNNRRSAKENLNGTLENVEDDQDPIKVRGNSIIK